MKTKDSRVNHGRSSHGWAAHSPADAAERIYNASHYRTLRLLRCEFAGGVLTISGRLSSFYLKQLAQTLVRGIDGVEQIVNEVHVHS
jgi:osmotically-inducible protein OsmY